jgi:hypothetical protein
MACYYFGAARGRLNLLCSPGQRNHAVNDSLIS